MDVRGLGALIVLVLAANAWEHSENTVFKKTSEVIITRSKWLITLVIDLQLYEILLAQLMGEVDKLETATSRRRVFTRPSLPAGVVLLNLRIPDT